MEQQFSFEGHPGRTLTVWLYTQVSNSKELRTQLVAGTLVPEVALINAALVPDLLVLRAAAYKALTSQKRGKLITRSLHVELVYNLSGSKHIRDSLQRYGIADDSQHLLVARFDAQAESVPRLEGKQLPLDDLPTLTDIATLTKNHKLSPQELQRGPLSDAILCRIAARDC